jgi:geranylgeranyl pyrophosphate synthase
MVKTAGKDANQHKVTFPVVYGMEASRVMARRELAAAHGTIDMFGDKARRLHELADLVVQRRN